MKQLFESEKHEKECIEKLFNARKEYFKQVLENITKNYLKIIDEKQELDIVY